MCVYIVMAYIVMAYIFMAYIVMAYIVMAICGRTCVCRHAHTLVRGHPVYGFCVHMHTRWCGVTCVWSLHVSYYILVIIIYYTCVWSCV